MCVEKILFVSNTSNPSIQWLQNEQPFNMNKKTILMNNLEIFKIYVIYLCSHKFS